MAENYVVNYTINVTSAEATTALKQFQTTVTSLTSSTNALSALNKVLSETVVQFAALSKKGQRLKISTGSTEKKLDRIIQKLTKIRELSGGNIIFAPSNTTTGALGGGNITNTKSTSRVKPKKKDNNLGYKLFGPTPLPSGGGVATDILQGFGVAYGLSGIGQMMSEIVTQSTAYDNTMQTVENILKSHDTKGDFASRFSNMSNTVRNVGVETKFTVSEVADAAKFLAMAGINLDDIQSSIRPIADIALVGDTDLATTADLMTNVMTAYNINANKMRDTADVMTNTFTMTNTTLPEIAESYKYAASLLSTAGVEFESATAAIGVLGDAGIKGSQAGTTLRTIMANLANPTKKQSAAWRAIGVSTVDENGNQKSLLDIFQELNKKNLGVADYYKLFNKTAASGAAALASHADKWESVYLENLKSQGLAGQLAEKKKNTVQGLWAQVESSFVNTGMTIFQEKQGIIQSWMKEAISWLQSSDAEQKFREIGDATIEFVQALIEAVKWIAKLADFAGPVIVTWMKFQLVVAPVAAAIKAVKTAFLGLQGLGRVGGGIMTFLKELVGKASEATKAVENLTAAETAAEGGESAGGNAPEGGGNAGGGAGENKGKGFKGRTKYLWGKYGKPLVPIGLGAGAAWLSMEELTKENGNGWDMVSGIGYGLAGAFAMSGNLLAAGAAAAGGAVSQLIAWRLRIQEASEELAKFAEEHRIVGNVMLDSNDTTERSLAYIRLKYKDINEELRRRIELLREIANLEPTPSAPDPAQTGDVYSKLVKKFQETDGWFSANDRINVIKPAFQKMLADMGLSMSENWLGAETNIGDVWLNYSNYIARTADMAAAMEMLQGDYRKNATERSRKFLFDILYSRSSKPEDVTKFMQEFANQYDPSKKKDLRMPSDYGYLSTKEADAWTNEDIQKSYLGNWLVWKQLEYETESQQTILDFLKKREENKLTEIDVIKALLAGDPSTSFFLKNYDSDKIGGWYKSFGWNGTRFEGIGGGTPDDSAKSAVAAVSKLFEAIQRLGLAADPATQNLQATITTLYALGQKFLNPTLPFNSAYDDTNGGKITLDNTDWNWDKTTQLWKPASGVLKPITAPEMQERLSGFNKNGNGNGGAGDNANGNGNANGNANGGGRNNRGGAKASDYKNHYNNGNAAPKQVIVRIENLMNVKSVDLSNPDKAAVVANLKSELAQALVDVVHDFDETWHG